MATLKCNACGGIYDDVGADGVRYFHRCPPLSIRELIAAHVAGRLVLSARRAVELARAQADDGVRPPRPDGSSSVAVFWSSLMVERPNRRDDNVTPNPDHSKPGVPKAVGAGVTPVVRVDHGDGEITIGV